MRLKELLEDYGKVSRANALFEDAKFAQEQVHRQFNKSNATSNQDLRFFNSAFENNYPKKLQKFNRSQSTPQLQSRTTQTCRNQDKHPKLKRYLTHHINDNIHVDDGDEENEIIKQKQTINREAIPFDIDETENSEKTFQNWLATLRDWSDFKPKQYQNYDNRPNNSELYDRGKQNNNQHYFSVHEKLFLEARRKEEKLAQQKQLFLIEQENKLNQERQQLKRNIESHFNDDSVGGNSYVYDKLYFDHFRRQSKHEKLIQQIKKQEMIQLQEEREKFTHPNFTNYHINMINWENRKYANQPKFKKLKKKSLNLDNRPVEQRLIEWKYRNQARIKNLSKEIMNEKCTFQPKLSKSKSLIRKYHTKKNHIVRPYFPDTPNNSNKFSINQTKQHNNPHSIHERLYNHSKAYKTRRLKLVKRLKSNECSFSPNIRKSQKIVPAPLKQQRLMRYNQIIPDFNVKETSSHLIHTMFHQDDEVNNSAATIDSNHDNNSLNDDNSFRFSLSVFSDV